MAVAGVVLDTRDNGTQQVATEAWHQLLQRMACPHGLLLARSRQPLRSVSLCIRDSSHAWQLLTVASVTLTLKHTAWERLGSRDPYESCRQKVPFVGSDALRTALLISPFPTRHLVPASPIPSRGRTG